MTVLIDGLRVLNANYKESQHSVFTENPGTLSNDFFKNLLDMGTERKAKTKDKDIYEGFDRSTGKLKWMGTRDDLVFDSNSQLRAIVEVYGSDDSSRKFTYDFIKAWNKLMNAGRFDVK